MYFNRRGALHAPRRVHRAGGYTGASRAQRLGRMQCAPTPRLTTFFKKSNNSRKYSVNPQHFMLG